MTLEFAAMTSAVESVTVAVRDLDAAVRLFGRTLGLRTESDSRASVSLLGAWHYPVHGDVRLVELSHEGYPFGRLRLAQFEEAGAGGPGVGFDDPGVPSGATTLAVYGGADQVVKVLTDAGYECVRGPGGQDGGPGLYRNGENLELALLPGSESPRGAVSGRRIGEIASVTVHSRDPAAAERFYQSIGLVAGEGVPRVFRDRQQSSGAIQIRRLEEQGAPIPIHAPMPGHHYGINLLSLRCSDLDALETRLRASEVDIVTRPTHVAVGDGVPARVMLVRGPDSELLELVERDA
jgi:catechol 2,3-dioxygenase-like lactoylglutathione lyase family enzyme/extradiol dioxygenase family protein